MKLKILSLAKMEKGSKELPRQFDEQIRPDLIYRAVVSILSGRRQKYGADPRAGKKYSSEVYKRRRGFKGCYGIGTSRIPRKVMSRQGSHFNWTGAFSPGTVGGRRAHPPTAEKNWEMKINDKERKKAIRSALAATVEKKAVEKRGHNVPVIYPFIFESKIEATEKTKELKSILDKFGLAEELERVSKKIVRAGKGKMRGRKYKKSRGILLVVSGDCKLLKLKNIPGVEVAEVKKIDTEMLAPGTAPGRLTIFTDKAIETMEKEKLFL
jgi:large subunit ribosomal protein L4e